MGQILKLSFILLFLFLSQEMQAQQTEGDAMNPRLKYSSGISLYGVGPNAAGSVSYDYFLTPYLNTEAGIGFIGVHIGMKVHFWGATENKWTPYVGGAVARSLFPGVGTDYLPYFPIGVQFIGENQFNFAFEVAPFQLTFLSWNLAGVKIGYRW